MELPSILDSARPGGITALDIPLSEARRSNLRAIVLQPVAAHEAERFQALMVIREVLTRVEPDALGRALQRWNAQQGVTDEGLAIDGKTMCNAIDAEGRQVHMLGAVGHQSQTCHTKKKSAPCP